MPRTPEHRPSLDSLGFYLAKDKAHAFKKRIYVEFSVGEWYNVVYQDPKKPGKKFSVVAKVDRIETTADGTGVFTFRNLDGMRGRLAEADIISAVFRPPRKREENPWIF